MANFNLITSAGGKLKLSDRDSIVLGRALQADNGIVIGTVFKPATADDRDALVTFLQSLDYTARTFDVQLSYDVPGEGTYRVNARRQDTQEQLDAWIEQEREDMAKRLGLKDPTVITVTVTEV